MAQGSSDYSEVSEALPYRGLVLGEDARTSATIPTGGELSQMASNRYIEGLS